MRNIETGVFEYKGTIVHRDGSEAFYDVFDKNGVCYFYFGYDFECRFHKSVSSLKEGNKVKISYSCDGYKSRIDKETSGYVLRWPRIVEHL